MKAIAKKVAYWCLECESVKESEFEVVVYGLELIFGTILKYILLLGIGCLLNRGFEVLMILFSVAIFRTFAGGVHGRTSFSCFLYMLMICAVSVGLSELSTNLKGLIVPVIGYIFCLLVVYKYVPLQSLKKPIDDVYMLKKKKIGAFIVVAISVICFIAANQCIKWVFLYPIIIETMAIMFVSEKRRGLS